MHTSGIFTAEKAGTWTVYCNSSGVSGEARVVINTPPSADDDDDEIQPFRSGDDGGLPVLVIVLFIVIVLLLIIGIVMIVMFVRKKKGTGPVQQMGPPMLPAPPVGQLPMQSAQGAFPPAPQQVYQQQALPPQQIPAQPQDAQ